MHTCLIHVEHVHGTAGCAGDAGYAGDGAAPAAGHTVDVAAALLTSCSSAAAVAAAVAAAPAGWMAAEACRHTISLVTRQARQDSSWHAVLASMPPAIVTAGQGKGRES